MERSKRPTLALPTISVKVDAAPKQRRRLQKVPKVQNLQAKRAVPGEEQQSDSSAKSTSKKNSKPDTTSRPSLPLPALDLSDPVWSDFLRPSSGYHPVADTTLPRYRPESRHSAPGKVIPEFAHLSVDEKRRSCTDTLVAESPRNSSSSLRRQAKTPILRIGQLEAQARARNMARFAESPLRQETRVVSQPGEEEERNGLNQTWHENGRTASAEAIADQYRALLPSGASVYEDSHLKPEPLSPKERRSAVDTSTETRGLGIQGRHTRPQTPDAEEEEPRSATLELVSRSPSSSDDGTLYSYQEETIYFKPVSFSPEPKYPSTIYSDDFPISSPSPSPDKLSMQICVDLLARDLASAVSKKPKRSPREASALQVWIMIEAYERLRDQILHLGLRYEEVLSLEVMFDTWLKALYRLHGSLTGGDTASVSDYDELERATEVQLD